MRKSKKKKKTSNKPSKVKTLYYTYDIEYSANVFSTDHGTTDTDNKVISVSDIGSEEAVKETLFHEILHAACDDSFIFEGDNAEEHEEKMIRILSPRLMQIFRDNPKLVNYLFSESEE